MNLLKKIYKTPTGYAATQVTGFLAGTVVFTAGSILVSRQNLGALLYGTVALAVTTLVVINIRKELKDVK